MIVFGKVVPLEKAVNQCFDGISEASIELKIHSAEPDNDKAGCCDCGFDHNRAEYMLGYNPLIQVSNYRVIIDGLKDVAFFSLLALFLNRQIDLHWIVTPLLANDWLMLLDIFALKKKGHAETFDVVTCLLVSSIEVGFPQ